MSSDENRNLKNNSNSQIESSLDNLWKIIKSAAEMLKETTDAKTFLLETNKTLEDKIAFYETEISELGTQITEISKNQQESSSENDAMRGIINSLEEKISELMLIRMRFETAESENEALRKEINSNRKLVDEAMQLEDELAKAKMLVSQKELENKKLQAEIIELNQTTANISISQKDSTRKNIELNDRAIEIKHLNDEIAEYKSEIFKLKSSKNELTDADARIFDLENQLLKSEEYAKELSLKYEDEKVRFIAQKAALIEELNSSHNIADMCSQTIDELNTRILLLETETMDLDSIIIEKNREIAGLNEESTELTNKYSEAVNKIEELSLHATENEMLQNVIEKLELDKLELESLYKDLSVKMNTLNTEMQTLRNIIDQSAEEIKVLIDEKQGLLIQIEKNQNDIEFYESAVNESELKTAELNNTINELNKRINAHSEESAVFKKEIENIQILEQKTSKIEQEFIESEEENQSLRLESAFLKESLDSCKMREAELLRSINQLNIDIESAHEEIKRTNELRDKNISLEYKISELANIIELSKVNSESSNISLIDLEQKNNILESAIKTLNDDNNRLIEEYELLKEINKEYELKINELSNSVQSVNSDSESFQNLLREATENNDILVSAIQSIKNENLRLLEEYEFSIELNKENENKIAELKAAIEEMKNISLHNIETDSKISILEGNIQSLNSAVNEKESKINELSLELANIENDRKKYDEAVLAQSHLIQSVEKLQSENAEYRIKAAQYEILSANNNDNNGELEVANKRIKALENKIAELSNNLTVFDLNYEKANRKNQNLEDLLRTRYEHIKILEKDLNSLIDAKRNEQAEKDILAGQIETAIGKLNQLK